ncbi:FAD-binding oxidoreductase [Candidatus Pacearchaeota archaeon]|nr:FAD-binding oxidoreductase [Candidatus Pacearchaeota archaeon]
MKKSEELIPYSTDASMIEGNAIKVVFPKTIGEIRNIIGKENNITIRGGGTSLVGGAVPFNSVVMDLSKMNRILNLDAGNRIVEVEAGIILDELNNYLEKYNLEFPVQPSSHGVCTIGGMIAANAAGNRAIKYGKTRKWIIELEAVNGKGEVLKIKKSDLEDFSGMEGITGVIVSAKLKLEPKIKRTTSMFSIETLDSVAETAKKYKDNKEVSEIEILDKTTSSLLGLEEKYHLIVEFENEEGELKGKDYDYIMNLRDRAYPALANIGFSHIEDPEISFQKFKEFAEFLESERIPFFGHLGVGIIHPVFMQNQKNKIQRMFEVVKRFKGQITGEHGVGIIKKEFLDSINKKIIERIKNRHDPLCKMNCNKVINCGKKTEEKIEEAKDDN